MSSFPPDPDLGQEEEKIVEFVSLAELTGTNFTLIINIFVFTTISNFASLIELNYYKHICIICIHVFACHLCMHALIS